MSAAPNASAEYLRNAVLTATPEQLQLMLLDGAIRFSERGRAAIEQRDFEASFNHLTRAQQIVLQLQAGLRREVNPAIADQMAGLYSFMYRRLVDASMHRDVGAIDETLKILRHHRETWTLLIEKLARDQAPSTERHAAVMAENDAAASLSVEG